MIGVSACLAYSCIPWAGPIGCLEVGYVDGQIVLNPTNEQKHASQLDLTVAATDKKVIMIEAGAKELPDDIMYDASWPPTRTSRSRWPSSTRSWPRSAGTR